MSAPPNEFKKLFSPGFIGNLELKNRLITTAMVTLLNDGDWLPNEQLIQYFERKARGGWGLIITEDYSICPEAKTFKKMLGLWSDDQIDSNARMVERVHAAGGKICAQIFHPGRQTSRLLTGSTPVAPSAIREPSMKDTPRALKIDEIKKIIDLFAQAALRAKKAGFDMVEVHGAHGYLVSEFFSPYANKRLDQYGGSITNRARFALEVVEAIRDKVGKDFPISFRMNVTDGVEGGVTVEDAVVLAKLLEQQGVDLLNCSQGMYVSREVIMPPTAIPPANYAKNAARIKQAVNIPVTAVGRIIDPNMAESLLATDQADFIAMGRGCLADPYFPRKAQAGNVQRIIQCIGCCQGCTGQINTGNHVSCMLNPLTGSESEYDLQPVEKPKKVMVVGGGIAGCEAAIAAAHKGHDVVLCEKSDSLGGQWLQASIALGKEGFSSFGAWQSNELQELGVEVRLETDATSEYIVQENPDAVVVATGSDSWCPPISGLDIAPNIIDARKLLAEGDCPKGKIAVLGGGLVGAETALYLAEHGCQVEIFELLDEIASEAIAAPRKLLLESLRQRNVVMHTSSKVLQVGEDFLVVEHDGEEALFKKFDNVVVALGAKRNEDMDDLKDIYTGEIVFAGDAKQAKNALGNIREGFEAGLSI